MTPGDVKRKSKKDAEQEAVAGCLGLILGLLVIIPIIALLAWNLGVVGIVAASGGAVASINYWTALGASAGYLLLRGILKAIG